MLPLSSGNHPPFADAREAREWLTLLPLINVLQSRLELDDILGQLNTAQIGGLDLLKIVEALREPIHTTQDGLLAHYISKPLPLLPTEMQRWQEAQALWHKLETAYARCWLAARQGQPDLVEHHALLAERCLRYAVAGARGHLLVYQQIPFERWQRLFEYYRHIEAAGLAQTVVRDSLIDIHGTTTPQAVLIHILLLAAASPRQLTSKQLLWLDRRLEVLAVRTSLLPEARALPGKTCLQIDLAAPGPALRVSKPLQGASVREIDTLALAQVLTKRIKLLREGDLPQKLGLGNELAPLAAEALLTEQYRRWCEQPTDLPPISKGPTRSMPVGLELPNLHRLIAPRSFTPPPLDAPQLDRRALEALHLFGHASTSVNTPPPIPGVSETWTLLRESAQELLLSRAIPHDTRIGLQHLVGVAPAGIFLLGVVRTLEDTGEQMQLGVRLLPGVPQVAVARAMDMNRLGQNKYSEILMLPAVPALKGQASLILPTGWHRQGRLLEMWDGESLNRVRLVQALERGSNFERVLYVPAGS